MDAQADEIRQLERLVYGRADTPEQVAARAAATERLIQLRAREQHGAGAQAAASAPPVPAPRSRWMLPAIALAAAALVLGVVIWQLAPSVPQVAEPASPTPNATAVPTPASTEVPVAIVPPEGDFPLPPEEFPLRAPGEDGTGTVLDQWGLGVRDGMAAYGYVATGELVCIAVERPDLSRSGRCAATGDFLRDGLSIDSGAWTVFWYADGRVIWEG